MTYINDTNTLIKSFEPDSVTAVINYYKVLIERAINSDWNNFEVHISLRDLEVCNCNNKQQFEEEVMLPIIHSLSKKYTNHDKLVTIVSKMIKYPGEY